MTDQEKYDPFYCLECKKSHPFGECKKGEIMQIIIGMILMWTGICLIIFNFQNKLDKKMENNTNYSFSIKKLTFIGGLSDEKGNPVEILYLGAEKNDIR